MLSFLIATTIVGNNISEEIHITSNVAIAAPIAPHVLIIKISNNTFNAPEIMLTYIEALTLLSVASIFHALILNVADTKKFNDNILKSGAEHKNFLPQTTPII